MSVLNIRGVPEELSNAVRIAAVKAGVPIREFVIKSLSKALDVKSETPKPERGARPVASKRQTADVTTAATRTPRPGLRRKPKTETASEPVPKQEYCKHKLRFCPKCPGFH